MNREARQRETGDVDFFDRTPRILQAIERRFGHELEAGGAQFLEQIAQRDAFLCGQEFQICERKAGDRLARRAATTSLTRCNRYGSGLRESR